jgi:hypothetical protein
MQTPKDLLEQMIDSSNLFAILELIEVICEEKAEHLRSNWQDEALTKAWSRAAYRVAACANSKEVLSLP